MNSIEISQYIDLRKQGLLFLLAVLCLGGCAQSREFAARAPAPPAFYPHAEREDITKVQIDTLSAIETAAGAGADGQPAAVSYPGLRGGEVCRAKPASGYLLAYQWGEAGHNAFGVGAGETQLKYTYSFQPSKKKKPTCVQNAVWQSFLTFD